jgi:hypothetical protein
LASAPAVSQIDRIRNRKLGSSAPYVRDSRRAQAAPKIVEPTAEQVTAAQKTLGVDPLKRTAKKEILCHSCFDQRRDETKPKNCGCNLYCEYWQARNLIDYGWADFLIYRRAGREHQNRKSIVFTGDYLVAHAKSEDALNHKLPLSLSAFTEYQIASITAEATSGLDQEINNVRRATIHERKTEVESRRKHHVGPANFRKGAGGLTVGVGGKIVDLTAAGAKVKKGYAPDSDSSRDDILAGNIVGQMNSEPDPNYSRGVEGCDNLDSGPKAIPGSKIAKLESARNLPKSIAEQIGAQEIAEFEKQIEDAETTVMTGVE